MSNLDARATRRTATNGLGDLDLAGIDAAILQLDTEMQQLRRARELVVAREKLRADLAKLDHSLACVIAGGADRLPAAPATAPKPAPAPAAAKPPAETVPPLTLRRKTGRPAVQIEHNGLAQGIAEWANDPAVKAKGITETMLRHRLAAGWPVERALTEGRGVHIASVDPEAKERKLAAKDEQAAAAAVVLDIDAAAAGLVSGPALQQQLDAMEGKPVVLPAGMGFVFDPAAPAADIPSLRAETVRRQRGGKQRTVEFTTTASRNHVHVAVVDHFGDGQTRPDSTGHVHRLARWKMIEAHRHEHGLVLTARSA